jgi:hypothetical protein
MNPLRAAVVAAGVFSVMTSAVFAEEDAVTARAQVAPRSINVACTTSYSVEVPALARVQGTAFFRTMLDIVNNTNKTIKASYQYSYSCFPTSCGGNNFFRTPGDPATIPTLTIPALGDFHQDDFIGYLGTVTVGGNPILQPGGQFSIGTLLVTFSELPSCEGWEGNVVARTYNHLDETTPSSATVGFAYNASLFFESAHKTLVGTARDTKGISAPTAGKLRSNVGVRNTDINGTNQPLTLVLSFYDIATGQKVGNDLPTPALQPGQLVQFSDLWTVANLPSTTNQVIIFVDNPSGNLNSPTFEGFVTIIDGGSASSGATAGIATQDAAYFEMRCGDGALCGQ